MQTYRDLKAWQKSLDLAQLIYSATETFPRREWYGLAAQMRRAAVSIPSNLAEGNSHQRRAYRHYVVIARGSEFELRTQIELARRLKLLEPALEVRILPLLDEVGRLTQGLLKSLTPVPPDA